MKHRMWISVILFFALIPMLYRSEYVTAGARYGLLLWYNSVVPALFPFMVISSLIVSCSGVPVIMEPFYHVLRHVLPISKEGCYVLVSGLLCGYPMGARTCADFVSNDTIPLREGQFLMAICNHPSPMFLLGYVYPFFSETFSVWELLVCVYAPILVLSIFANIVYFKVKPGQANQKHNAPGPHTPVNIPASETHRSNTASPDEAILSAVTILCKIGGYLVLFSILIIFLREMVWLPEKLRLVLIGALEMTTGIRELCAALPIKYAYIGSMASLTFGGCSGIFQTKAVLGDEKKAGLSIRPYIFWKLIHAAMSAGIAVLLCNFH